MYLSHENTYSKISFVERLKLMKRVFVRATHMGSKATIKRNNHKQGGGCPEGEGKRMA